MANLGNFNANDIDPIDDFEPIPAGKYTAVITDSEMKPTKSGTGHYLELKFQIIDGPHKGRLLWARLNLDNPNPTAMKIAKRELSSICRAVGVLTPNDSVELHNLPLLIDVRQKEGTDGVMRNEIKGYRRVEQASAPLQTSSADNTPPWAR